MGKERELWRCPGLVWREQEGSAQVLKCISVCVCVCTRMCFIFLTWQ